MPLPPNIAVRTAALADVFESLLARWETEDEPTEEAREALRRASHAVLRFRDEGLDAPSPIDPLDAALRCVERALAVGAPDAEVFEAARDELVRLRRVAFEQVPTTPSKVAPARSSGGTAFRASLGAPVVRHDVAIPPITLLPEELQIDDDDDDDNEDHDDDEAPTDAEPTPHETLQRSIDSPELVQLRSTARDVMEDLGVLGGLRRPLPDEPWTAPITFERRLLAQVDALFALSRSVSDENPKLQLVEELHAYATQWAIPDSGRSFALAMPLACIEGESAARWLLASLRSAHPRTHDAFADALALGPSSAIPKAVEDRLASTEPRHVLVTLLDVARRRGDIDPTVVAMLLAHPSDDVAAAAARAAVRIPKATASRLLNDALAVSGPVQVAAAESLAYFGHPAGVASMRGWLEDALVRSRKGTDEPDPVAPRALRVLACAGRPEDEELVTRAALTMDDGLYWLGLYGRAGHAARLCEAAERPGEAHPARRGLELMLGGRWDVDVDVLNRDPGMREELERDWKRRRNAAKEQTGRLRAGETHRGASSVLAGLSNPEMRAAHRTDLALELGMSTGGEHFVSLEDWIPRQRAVLEVISARVAGRWRG